MRTSRRSLAVALGACLAVPIFLAGLTDVGRAAERNGASRSSIARGETLVRRNCGGCHAIGKSGSSPLAAAPPLRELHHRYEPETLAEALAEGILTGHRAMPEFRFSVTDVQAVIAYLDSIQTRQAS